MAVDSYMTLSQLQERIRETLCRGFAAPVWITAEIGELKVNARSGHCYLQLVEKGGRNGVPQAQVQAVIWADSTVCSPLISAGRRGRSWLSG